MRDLTSKHLYRFGVMMLGCLLIFSCLAPALATDTPPAPLDEGTNAVEEALITYYIWLCMRAWGIEVTYGDVDGYCQEISDQMMNWIFEYLEDTPSIYSINTWIAPWQANLDYWGNYQFNDSLLEDVQDFVDWLCNLLGATDNSTIIINPNYVIGGYNLYESNKWYEIDTAGQYTAMYDDFGYFRINTGNQTVKFFVVFYNDAMQFMLVDNTAWSIDYTLLITDDFHNIGRAGSGSQGYYNVNGQGVYYNAISFPYNSSNNAIWYPSGGTYFYSNANWQNWSSYNTDIKQFMNTAVITEIGDTKVICSDIILPVDNPDYTPGDSIHIVDNQPDYLQIEWNGEVTVSNLPAIVSTGTVQEPGLQDAFSPIIAVIDYSADAIAAIVGIMYEFPEEVIIPIYALMGAIIVFGTIKLMREH